jgi:molybdopterin-guanine dinucleotide biosynthesis protein B
LEKEDELPESRKEYPMIPIVAFVGRPGAGKTTFLDALIPLLRAKGYRIGTIKHGVHGFHLDQAGKDSWRHAQAGAEVAIISTPQGLGVFRSLEGEMSLEELIVAYLPDIDLVLAEGFKGERIPKIEVHRGALGGELLTGEQDGLLGVVSDVVLPTKVPLFSPNDPQSLADYLEDKFLRQRASEEIQLAIDGRRVPLNPFVQDLFHSLLLAMVAPLKGIGPFSQLSLRLDASPQKKVAPQ